MDFSSVYPNSFIPPSLLNINDGFNKYINDNIVMKKNIAIIFLKNISIIYIYFIMSV